MGGKTIDCSQHFYEKVFKKKNNEEKNNSSIGKLEMKFGREENIVIIEFPEENMNFQLKSIKIKQN